MLISGCTKLTAFLSYGDLDDDREPITINQAAGKVAVTNLERGLLPVTRYLYGDKVM
jgi:hypothetical protein